jgi:putative transposase
MQDINQFRRGRTTISKCFYHLVLTPKYRRDVFTTAMLKDLEALMQETCEQMGGELIEFGCEDDHLHLILVIPPSKSVSNFVGKLKGKSAHFLRKHHWDAVKKKLWGEHFWSPSYCIITCGGTTLDVIKKYVEGQTAPSI